jgi:hypothetical protein
MKYFSSIISIFPLFLAVLFAQSENNPTIYIKISNVSPNDFITLQSSDIDVENVKNKNEIYAYVTKPEYDRLTEKGYQVEVVPDRAKIYADSLWLATRFSSNPLDAYHTFEELTIELQELAQQYSEICLLESIGKSAQGMDLWIMKISDNVAVEEFEPEFKYISSIHGDEPIGMEMCNYLIHHLVEDYGIDPRITQIVDETEIWIMPLMNPDGYVLRQRRNYNVIDLNRNFPDRIIDPSNTPAGREPETRSVMNFSSDHSFVLSANFHTGASVANYPYDGNASGLSVYTACPDDSLFIELAKTYSSHNFPMWNSPYFSHGITNGADWYVVYGGMQDWNYVWMGCNELTIELSGNKWPNASLLPSLWDDNRESMLSFMETIHWGVRGIISDAFTGKSISATAEVIGVDHKVHSDPDVGDYYRMLLPGTYKFRFSADDYFSQEFDSVLVRQGYITYLDLQLIPASRLTISGTVKARVTGKPIVARLTFNGAFNFSTFTDSLTGAFQISVPADSYEVEIRNDRYLTLFDTITVSTDINLNYGMQPYLFVFDEDFEIDKGGFIPLDTLWQWGVPGYGADKAYSDQKLWGTALQGSYPVKTDAKLVTPFLILPEADNLILSFWHWMEAETDMVFPEYAYDGGIVELSSDNGISWTQIYPKQGYSHKISEFAEFSPFPPGTSVYSGQHDWKEAVFDLDAYKGMTVQIQFYFGSDDDNDYPYAGWYLDNVAIKYPYVQRETVYLDNPASPDRFWLSQNYPNPFNSNTAIAYALPRASHVMIAIYNIKGQIAEVLIDQEQESGTYELNWDGTDDNGHPITSGVYIILMKCGEQLFIRKALVLR